MDTEIPQSSVPTKHVADKVVHKERGDSLVRAATTTSSLEAEQDSGNIDKTQSKTTLNESSSPETSSGGGPKRVKKLEQKKRSRTHKLKRLRKVGATARVESSSDEESLGEDASKQGRIDAIDADDDITLVSVHDVNVSAGEEEVFEVINTAKLIIDAAQVSAAGDKVSAADAATTVSVATTTTATTVKESTLAQALADLKSTKPKAKGITFKEPGKSITTTTPIPSKIQDKGKAKMIEPEPMKKLSKKDQLKLDEEIALKLQAEIDEEERIARAKEEKINEANIAWDDIQEKVDADYQLAERLQVEEQEQFIIEQKATLFKELLEQRRKHFTAKRAEEKRNKPPTKNQQKKTMITYLKNMEGWKHKDLKSKDFDSIKELFDRDLKRVNMFVDFRTELVEGSSKRVGTELEQEVTKKQNVDDVQETAEVDNNQEAAKIKELMEIVPYEEEVAIDAIPLAVKPPSIVDWKIHTEGKKIYYQIIRADGKSQMYLVFSHMLKSFDMEDLKTLWKLVKAKHGSTRPEKGYERVLWCDLKIYMLVEKKYHLTPATITDMLNKKLQCDHFSEMAYQLLKSMTKQVAFGRIRDAFSVSDLHYRFTHSITMTTASQGMILEGIKHIVAKRVANAIKAIAIYEPINHDKQQENKVAGNASNKRKWEGDHNGSFSLQQNKEHKVFRAHTVRLSNKEDYAGNLP
ncbi:hypothetical protein Tco_1228366, partial [Tanacetum coccineum]